MFMRVPLQGRILFSKHDAPNPVTASARTLRSLLAYAATPGLRGRGSAVRFGALPIGVPWSLPPIAPAARQKTGGHPHLGAPVT